MEYSGCAVQLCGSPFAIPSRCASVYGLLSTSDTTLSVFTVDKDELLYTHFTDWPSGQGETGPAHLAWKKKLDQNYPVIIGNQILPGT